jgi:effector-binding domain-containing protein
LFKIGDFSKFTRISIRMLRHYDEIGILKPAKIDKFTNYRLYSVDQIPIVNKIQALKEMGFSLSEISKLIKNNLNLEDLLILLENRKREIELQIKSQEEKLLRVNSTIKFISEENYIMNYDITIKSIPKYRVICLRDTIPTYSDEGTLWKELCDFISKNDIKISEPCYAIYYDEGYKDSNVDVEITQCLIGNVNIKESERIKVRELERVEKMASIFHKGPFKEMAKAYHALGVWMESNNYEWDGPSRAIYHKGPWSDEDSENFLTEIQAPIKNN